MASVVQWVQGTRPRTLPNSIAPVIVGQGQIHTAFDLTCAQLEAFGFERFLQREVDDGVAIPGDCVPNHVQTGHERRLLGQDRQSSNHDCTEQAV